MLLDEVGADIDQVGASALEPGDVDPILGEIGAFEEEVFWVGPRPGFHPRDGSAAAEVVGAAADLEEMFIGDNCEIPVSDGAEEDDLDEVRHMANDILGPGYAGDVSEHFVQLIEAALWIGIMLDEAGDMFVTVEMLLRAFDAYDECIHAEDEIWSVER